MSLLKVNPIFSPDDFSQFLENSIDIRRAAEIANSKLESLVESWPVIYGDINYGDWTVEHVAPHDTHSARLAFVSELNPTTNAEQIAEKFVNELIDASIQAKEKHMNLGREFWVEKLRVVISGLQAEVK